jgi:hypothetical protein
LIGAARTGDLHSALERAIAAIRRGILEACGAADLAGVEVVLTPSGTDGEYAALHLAGGASKRPIVNIVIAPEETGSGVLAAAQGRHFAGVTPSGAAARPDAAIGELDSDLIKIAAVPIRGSDGQPRPLAEIDAEVAALVEQALAACRRCLVHVLAGSKTGLFAPSFHAAQKLTARRGDRVDVVVDACQMRLSPERIRACLAAGWMVLVTGSKFFGGPPFAGALLLPADIVARAAALAPLPAGLGDYFSRAEWPQGLQHLTGRLPDRANLGLVLRWQAALWEIQAFRAVPQEQRTRSMTALAAAVRTALAESHSLRPMTVDTPGGWPQTIFPFEVLHGAADGTEKPLDIGTMKQVHRWLNADISEWLATDVLCSARRLAALPCHLGQPVAVARTAVLRLCIGAHLVWETAFDHSLGSSFEARLEAQIQRARLSLRKVELIARYYGSLSAAAAAAASGRPALDSQAAAGAQTWSA